MRIKVPSEPTQRQSFLDWHFIFYISERDWDGLVMGKAEVHRDGTTYCTFNLARKAAAGAVQTELKEECIAWIREYCSRAQ